MGRNSKTSSAHSADASSAPSLTTEPGQSTRRKQGNTTGTKPQAKPSASGSKRKTGKYGNKKTVVDGITFDSKKEALRYQGLKIDQDLGYISNLQMQVPFELAPGVRVQGRKRPPLRYVADFTYDKDGFSVVEDSKGMKTPVYKLKRHLMMAIHGIEIYET